MTDDACDLVLRRTNVGHLGCAKDNQPYVVPVYFKFDAVNTPGQGSAPAVFDIRQAVSGEIVRS